jgi:aromatic ring-opening dioxygenase catalytic subunit (LigB family)
MVFDYYGFPEHLYQIKYGAPRSPEVAIRVRAILRLAVSRATAIRSAASTTELSA